MSAQLADYRLRERISKVLADIVLDNPASVLADITRVNKTTIPRRGDDLNLWPSDHLMAVADHFPELAEAIVARLRPHEQEPPQATRVVRELFGSLEWTGEFVSNASQALSDGRIDRDEAKALRNQLREARIGFEQLDRDLAAIAD